MYWTAVCMGSIAMVVQSVAKPYCAPAWAYVPMPEGSSSDAPVIRPGPRALPRRLKAFFSALISAALGSTGLSACTRGSPAVGDRFRSGTASSPRFGASPRATVPAEYDQSGPERSSATPLSPTASDRTQGQPIDHHAD